MSVRDTDITSTALSLVGKLKYVFGSDNINGGTGDCSSFTEYVFGVHGIDIGADTRAQSNYGYSVGLDELLPSDLVLFQGTYRKGVSHVGIYVGNDKMVHLGSSGCKVVSLSDYLKHTEFHSARRSRDVEHTGEVIESEVTDGKTPTTGESDVELVWWGDIVKVVCIVGLIIGGVVLLSASFLGGVKVPDVVKGVTKNVTE